MSTTADLSTPESSALSGPLERVMRQVLAMKEAGDIDSLIREVWDVLVELEYDFVSCAFLLMEEERGWLTSYNVWEKEQVAEFYGPDLPQHARRLENGLVIFSGQTPLDKAPKLYNDAVAAWRQGTVERHPLSTAEIDEITRLNTQRYGGPAAPTYPIRFNLHIPFAYGVFTLRTCHDKLDQFSAKQIGFLKRLVEILAVGHTRYREFLRLDRDRTVQRLRAEVQAMRQGEDIVDLMGRVWEELQRAGIEFDYMSVAVWDGEEDCVHIYGAVSSDNVVNDLAGDIVDTLALLKSGIVEGVDLFYRQTPRAIWQENRTDVVGVRHIGGGEMSAYLERMKRLWQVKEFNYVAHAYALMAAALPQGRIVLIQSQRTAEDPPVDFTPEDQEILETFAEALGLGFARFFDFQHLEAHNRRLQEGRALERVRAEILGMEQSSDILGIVRLIWRELKELGHDFQRCSISMFDEERDLYSGYFTTQKTEWLSIPPTARNIEAFDDSFSHSLEHRLSDGRGPFRTELLDAWRGSEIFQGRIGNAADKQGYADYARRVHAIEIDVSLMPDTAFLYVPFAQGVFGGFLYDSDKTYFSAEQTALFRRFGEVFGEGYSRFQELRQREVQRGVEQLRAEVASMRQSSDIADVAILLGRQLRELGLEFFSSSFGVVNEETSMVHLYAVVSSDFFETFENEGKVYTTADRSIIGQLDDLDDIEGPVYIEEAIPGFTFGYRREPLHESPVAEKDPLPRLLHRNEAEAQQVLDRFQRNWAPGYPLRKVPRSVIRVPFSHGDIAISHLEPDRFTQRDVDLVAAYADAVSLGLTRFHDFQRLERRNRELEIERAVGRVQIAVQNMKNSVNLLPIMTLFTVELQSLGLDYTWGTISIVDREADKVRVYGTIGADQQSEQQEAWIKLLGSQEMPFSATTMERIENEAGPFFITGISGSQIESASYMSRPLDSYHGRLQQMEKTTRISYNDTELVDNCREYKLRWKVDYWPEELMLRSILRTPFSGGTIALSDYRSDHFSGRDAQILERFAEAFSLGYARYLDFRNLERRNRELEIERGVERVQIAVQNMMNSADLLPVITLFSIELQSLGVDYSWCTISIVDHEADKVRIYGTIGDRQENEEWAEFLGSAGNVELPFSAQTMERVENEDGPFYITGIPGGQIEYANYMSRPLDSYHGRLQQAKETTFISRNDAEVEAASREYMRAWKVDWPFKLMLRSILRTPFAGGTIALGDPKADHFSGLDARILERFAEAFSLGYARYLDFRNLERRNRELEIERAVERVQIAVQNMMNSADIVSVMPLLFEEIQRVGLSYYSFSVSIVDEEKGRVRVYVTGEPLLPLLDAGADYNFGHEDFSPAIFEQLDRDGGPVCISFAGKGIDQQDLRVHCISVPLDSYHGHLQQTRRTTISSRSDEELRPVVAEMQRRWKTTNFTPENAPRSVLRVPFAGGGTIALCDPKASHFTQRDARILERFAEAFSLGHTRYLDFRRLEEQNRALEAANRVKSEFLANMSHELRTPMNAIINFSSMLLDGVAGEIPADVRDMVEEIDHNGANLLVLINDVLDLSKIEAGAMQLERAPCDPAACVENAVAALERDAGDKGLELEMQIEDLPPILADERRLTQHVLLNLVKNAIKFTAAGKVTVGTRHQNGEVLFWVEDTGIGIPATEQERIFETFHQVDGSITRQAEGTGLGLAIARKFVELHRGRIWVESQAGEGAIFYVALPLKG
jgi:signal transduction histidine kinase